MMERSSRFLSLSGLAGILAGTYALVGAFVAHTLLKFRPTEIGYSAEGLTPQELRNLLILAGIVLVLSVGSAIWLSYKRSLKREESFWNATSRKLVYQMGIPLATGGVLLLVMMVQGLTGLLAPMTLIFYGLSLYNAGLLSYHEVKSLGLIQVAFGLISAALIEYQLLFWAAGFGVMHIVYGILIHLKYER